ncbi:hypothetical protein EYF80_012180 [Liparis tanakae]|uniref:Uncharacterized protein n=1 Tax=Liparis tanakae TaxID=230148 RepID=A0A4Z2IHY3_9TELE|nr:hypothetical protein EYF80_012180 [Liparis tanakae]
MKPPAGIEGNIRFDFRRLRLEAHPAEPRGRATFRSIDVRRLRPLSPSGGPWEIEAEGRGHQRLRGESHDMKAPSEV